MSTVVEISNVGREDSQVRPRPPPQGAHAIHRILVCVDHSPFSEICLRFGIAISRSLGAAITVLHVMPSSRERSGVQATDALDWEIGRQEAGAYLEKLREDGTLASGKRVDTRLEQGRPAERITAVAREIGADLTVLGSQGDHSVSDRTLGSTAQQVLEAGRGSVLVARSASTASTDVPVKRILVPLDGSTRAESVLPTAVRIAGAHGAELLLAFVVKEPVATAVLSAPEDIEAARALASRAEVSAKRYLEGLRDKLVREGASARTVVLRSGDERQSLLELSRRERSDLIVLSAHGSTCNPNLTAGSVTVHLLAHSTVPLLVLQDLRDSELRGREGEHEAPPLRGQYPERG
jgi:nucleotide-binding universal stress UspA family protein